MQSSGFRRALVLVAFLARAGHHYALAQVKYIDAGRNGISASGAYTLSHFGRGPAVRVSFMGLGRLNAGASYSRERIDFAEESSSVALTGSALAAKQGRGTPLNVELGMVYTVLTVRSTNDGVADVTTSALTLAAGFSRDFARSPRRYFVPEVNLAFTPIFSGERDSVPFVTAGLSAGMGTAPRPGFVLFAEPGFGYSFDPWGGATSGVPVGALARGVLLQR